MLETTFIVPFSHLFCYMQARFSLTSAQVFSHTDHVTDSERFYNSILELLEDPEERDEVDQLMAWWNRYVVYYLWESADEYLQTSISTLY